MPIYEYRCPECGETFEKRQSFNAEPVADCVECDFSGAKRKISAPAIVFKGSGFYVTDTRKGSSKNASPNNGSKKSDNGANTNKETKTSDKKSSTDSKKVKKEAKAA
ncbi:zinc ribbon domain-containing protein [Anaerolineales bacterium HSG6]|nr:zinc ribbon domain-containing protein [Anaerolineales bacterium HSG6]MDM8530786.1 zinc ribbon domain-containing protein [Anaerolineales bacterium HSG25]